MNRELIDRYIAGADALRLAVAGLEPAELNAFPVPGTWSIQQIVLHLMDSDLIGSDRMKRVIAEENPPLLGFDETAFVNKLGYEHLSVKEAAEIFRLNRLMTGEILRHLPDSAFERTGQHSERGPLSLQQLVKGFANHLEHHLKFVREKRQLLSKPAEGGG